MVLFNNITQWVQCMVLDHHKPQERATAIVKFVEIAKVNILMCVFMVKFCFRLYDETGRAVKSVFL